MVQNKKLFKATWDAPPRGEPGAWDAPPPNRLEEIKRIFKAFFFAMLLFFTLLKAALKRTGSAWRSTAASRKRRALHH